MPTYKLTQLLATDVLTLENRLALQPGNNRFSQRRLRGDSKTVVTWAQYVGYHQNKVLLLYGSLSVGKEERSEVSDAIHNIYDFVSHEFSEQGVFFPTDGVEIVARVDPQSQQLPFAHVGVRQPWELIPENNQDHIFVCLTLCLPLLPILIRSVYL